jgi:hypothetical protein
MKTTIKKLFALLLLVNFTNKSQIFAQAFEKEKNYVSAGYGINGLNAFLSSIKSSYSTYDNYKLSSFGPLVLNYERGIKDRFGVGLHIDYSTADVTFRTSGTTITYVTGSFGTQIPQYNTTYYNSQLNFSLFSMLLAGYYHYKLKNDKLDLYSGAGIGFVKIGAETKTDDINLNFSFAATGVNYKICSGARYMFTDKIGAYAEIAVGYTFMHGGLVVKL